MMIQDYHQKPLMTFLNDCIHPQIKEEEIPKPDKHTERLMERMKLVITKSTDWILKELKKEQKKFSMRNVVLVLKESLFL